MEYSDKSKDSYISSYDSFIENNSRKYNIRVDSVEWVHEYYPLTGYYNFTIKFFKENENKNEQLNDTDIIKRRFSEIEWLHDKLTKYSACKIPNLPKKNFMTNIMIHDQDQIKKRQKDLNWKKIRSFA